MLFVDFSSAFNKISPMKLANWALWAWVLCNWILDFLTNRPQTDWLSCLLHSCAQHWSPPGLYAKPPPVHTVHLRLQSPTWRELCCEVCGQHHHYGPDFKRWDFISEEINNLAEYNAWPAVGYTSGYLCSNDAYMIIMQTPQKSLKWFKIKMSLCKVLRGAHAQRRPVAEVRNPQHEQEEMTHGPLQ